jgi:hypothetical protein
MLLLQAGGHTVFVAAALLGTHGEFVSADTSSLPLPDLFPLEFG